MASPDTPAVLGYRMPAEWEPHGATWVAWPHNRDTWPGKFEPVPGVFAELILVLARSEPVCVLAGRGEVMREAQAMVVGRTANPSHSSELANVTLYDVATNDAWIRDYGPTFLAGPADAPAALVDWEYNAWGGKYPPFDLDNGVPERIAALSGRRRFRPRISQELRPCCGTDCQSAGLRRTDSQSVLLFPVLEGGAIDSNGRGTLLAAESCLLHSNRNPGRSRREMERCLADYLGARHVVWLSAEIAGDDTDGHVDQFARFVGPTTVVAAREKDSTDANYAPLEANFARLKTATDQDGRALEVATLPMPRPIYYDGRRLPASYANFYVANRLVVVPVFDDPADAEACETLGRLFPGRRICGLNAVDLVWGLGAFHCATQQEVR